MSCWAQSQTLYWISQINLCEILFLQDNLPEFFTQVRKLESDIEASFPANPEISCQLNILKLNVILDSGLEIDNFSDIALWSLPYGACSFSNLQIASENEQSFSRTDYSSNEKYKIRYDWITLGYTRRTKISS